MSENVTARTLCATNRHYFVDGACERCGEGEPDDCGGICYWCGGEGWEECDDPIQCTNAHSKDGLCRCKSCGGSGLAKDMTIW